MPQTNKAISGPGGPGQASAPDRGEPPPIPDARDPLATGDGAEAVAQDQGDLHIIKSPSDQKKYR